VAAPEGQHVVSAGQPFEGAVAETRRAAAKLQCLAVQPQHRRTVVLLYVGCELREPRRLRQPRRRSDA
jgi:hypothetical protein